MSVSKGNPGLIKGMTVTGATIAAYRIVKGDTSNTTNALKACLSATADTEYPLGVTVEATATAGDIAAIALSGIVLVEMNGDTVDIGTPVAAQAAGKGGTVTAADATQRYIIGAALEPSTADGDIIEVLIDRQSWVEGAA